MRAAFLERFDGADPADVVRLGERPDPVTGADWEIVRVKAASLNHHDVWNARGQGILRGEQLPMILGCDAAGIDSNGAEVIVHPFVNSPSWDGPELLDPRGTLLSDLHQGTFAELVAVPRSNLVSKPETLSFAEAACLPTAWLTAYRMLFVQAAMRPGQTALVQGAGGGLATALVMLGATAGVRVWVTGRSERTRSYALAHGAAAAFEPGARLPDKVDAVMDSVGVATFAHSLRVVKRGGVVVTAGATAGSSVELDVSSLFSHNIRIVGSIMGTRQELNHLVRYCAGARLHPPVERLMSLEEAPAAVRAMSAGEVLGKVVLHP